METIIKELIILGLFCNGLWIAAQPNFILYRPAEAIRKLPEWINKPIIGCVYCMASVWGIVLHSALYYLGYVAGFYELPIIIICGVFVNGFMHELFNKL